MLTLMWHLSSVIRGYLRVYMPTNIAIDLLRTHRGLKWAIPVSLVAVPTYLFAMDLCASIAAGRGPGWLNVLVILFAWNAMKFAWMAVFGPRLLVRSLLRDAVTFRLLNLQYAGWGVSFMCFWCGVGSRVLG